MTTSCTASHCAIHFTVSLFLSDVVKPSPAPKTVSTPTSKPAPKPKELSNPATEAAKSKPATETCREVNCSFVGTREVLVQHYVDKHQKSEEEIYRLTPRRAAPTPSKQPLEPETPVSTPTTDPEPSIRLGERLFQCPGCDRAMRASLLRRHIMAQHPDICSSNGVCDAAILERAMANVQVIPRDQVAGKAENEADEEAAEGDDLEDGKQRSVSGQRNLPVVKTNLVPASEACVPCSAPGCNKFIHHSNMSRHWRCWHPDLDKNIFLPKKPVSRSNPCSPNSKNQSDDDATKRLAGDELLNESSPMIESPLHRLSTPGFNLPMANGLYACRSGDCNYFTKYNSNMWRHRRKYNHFVDVDASILSPAKPCSSTEDKTAAVDDDSAVNNKSVELDHIADESHEKPEPADEETVIAETADAGVAAASEVAPVDPDVVEKLEDSDGDRVEADEGSSKTETDSAPTTTGEPEPTSEPTPEPEASTPKPEVTTPKPAKPKGDKITAYFMPVTKSAEKENNKSQNVPDKNPESPAPAKPESVKLSEKLRSQNAETPEPVTE